MFRLVTAASRENALCIVSATTPNVKIGRDPKTCAVPLGTKAVAVSREHAELQWNENGVMLLDTSSFGTLVDGVKIVKSSKLLKGGERLKIGQEEFILERTEEVNKVAQNSKLVESKPVAKNSIASYFTKNVVAREESQPADVSVRNVLAAETPSQSQESVKGARPVESAVIRKPDRGARRVNPLLNFTKGDESILSNVKPAVLAIETPSDSLPSQRVNASIVHPSPALLTSSLQGNTTVEMKKKKMPLFSKQSQRAKTQKPLLVEDDEIMEVNIDVSTPNGNAISQMDGEFIRPSLPRTRVTNKDNSSVAGPSSRGEIAHGDHVSSTNYRVDIMGVNASSISTQVIPTTRKPIGRAKKNEPLVVEPPRKKTKSIFADHFKRQKQLEMKKPKEKSLLDEDGNVEINIRYDHVPAKTVVGERAYSSWENVAIMDQMKIDAAARLEKRYGKMDEMESQYPSVEELASVLCSSYSEDKKGDGEEKKKGVERVGDETLDEEIKSQLVTFSDDLVVSQSSFDSMPNPTQGKGFKKFKKARQGRFASQSVGISGIIGGNDLVDFREIRL